MKRCTNAAFGPHSVQSDSSNKIYAVEIREDGEHSCNCPAMAIQNNKRSSKGLPRDYLCKHIQGVLAGVACTWTSDSPTPQQYPEICPLCSAPTEHVDTVTGDPDPEMMNDALAGLLALRSRLT